VCVFCVCVCSVFVSVSVSVSVYVSVSVSVCVCVCVCVCVFLTHAANRLVNEKLKASPHYVRAAIYGLCFFVVLQIQFRFTVPTHFSDKFACAPACSNAPLPPTLDDTEHECNEVCHRLSLHHNLPPESRYRPAPSNA